MLAVSEPPPQSTQSPIPPGPGAEAPANDTAQPAASPDAGDAGAPPRVRPQIVCICLLLVVGFVAYATSLFGGYVLDDRDHILDQSRIESILPVSETVQGTVRPMVRLSLAVNYALSEAIFGAGQGRDPFLYHAFNVMVHLLAGLTLFGVARRTIDLAATRALWRRRAPWIALAIALLWVVHPLTTQAVTYTIQRAESMAALCYLLALYALLVAGVQAGRARHALWMLGAAAACVIGAMCKPTIATAPVVLLLFDRAVVAGSFGAALRRRWAFYGVFVVGAVALSVVKILGTLEGESGSAGFRVQAFGPVTYLMNQPAVLVHYLRLAVWPVGLTFDYGWEPTRQLASLWPGWVMTGALVVLTLWALRRRPVLGTLGAAFFILLSPSSSIVPLRDLAAEHRMYLPLAAVVALIVVAGWWVIERLAQRSAVTLGVTLLIGATVVLGIGTSVRNVDYWSAARLWRDTIEKAPQNARAHHNLANVLVRQGALSDALPHFNRAIELEPNTAEPRVNLARTLARQGRLRRAMAEYRHVLEGVPDHVEALHGLGVVYARANQFENARRLLQRAISEDPSYAPAHADMGNVLMQMDQPGRAITAFRRALELDEDKPTWHNTLGRLLAQRGELRAALRHFRRAVALAPEYGDAAHNLRRAERLLRQPATQPAPTTRP